MAKAKTTRTKSAVKKTAKPDTAVTTRPEERDVLDVNQAGEYLAVARSTMYKLIERGAVPHMKIGGSVRFSRKMLLEWVEAESRKSIGQEAKTSEAKKRGRPRKNSK